MVLLADRSKTATKVQKTKKTPVFRIMVHVGERCFFVGEIYVSMLAIVVYEKPDEARDPDVMGNET